MQNNFAIEYQPTFFRKLHSSTLAESQKKIVFVCLVAILGELLVFNKRKKKKQK
jgi:hypothetical protein